MSEAVKEETKESNLVVIGSSAGGIEAISVLVSTLPTDFPAPIVLAQHLDPSRASNLDVIIRQHSTLPVELVTGRSHLKPGKVYVVPSNRQVSIEDGNVEVQVDANTRPRPRPSVDLLFASAAKAYVGQYGAELIQDCVQLHGGIGVTFEHDLHLFLRRHTLDRTLYGTPEEHRRRVARMVLATEGAA